MKKIMFKDKYGLTQSVLDGRKTMTRRAIKYGGKIYNKAWKYHDYYPSFKDALLKYSLYKIGETVAIAQSYQQVSTEMLKKNLSFCLDIPSKHAGWNNKSFVKAELMPHHIRITNVRVERLQDISDEDCIKEGIYTLTDDNSNHKPKTVYTYIGGRIFDKPQWAFRSLFIKTSRKRKEWEQNWWTYAYEFELVD